MRPYRTLLLAVACQVLSGHRVQAEVVSAVLLPHGLVMLTPDAYNGQSNVGLETAKQLYAAGVPVQQLIQRTCPELILLVTPHGQTVEDNITLYQHDHAAGTIKAAGAEHSTNIRIDTQTTASLFEFLTSQHQEISILQPTVQNATANTIALDWGEIIPWHILGSPTDIPAVIISLPSPKGSQTDPVPQLLTLGQLLSGFFNKSNSPKTLVVISADLAHTHSLEGPYGTSPAAALYDAAMIEWVATSDQQHLLETAAGLADDAETCGLMGSVLLQGILAAAIPAGHGTSNANSIDASHAEIGTSWQGQVLSYGHPTYFGMMVARWTPVGQQQQQKEEDDHHLQFKSVQGQLEQVLHAAFAAPAADQPDASSTYSSDVSGDVSTDASSSVRESEAGGSDTTSRADSSYSYEVEDVEQLRALRREAGAGWRTRSKHGMLSQRSRTCVI